MRSVVLLLSMSMLCILSSTISFQRLYGQNHQTIINSAISANLTESTVENSIPPQSTSSSSDNLKVVSSFYPIDEFVKKVGGDKIDSLVLIHTGLELHGLGLT